ncbi:MAG: hypothetical protein WC873_01830 [Candidatus Gracilibacteria bacterium]
MFKSLALPSLLTIPLLLFLFGCTNPETSVEKRDVFTDAGGDILPEQNCLGLTAENVQNFCGSGPLVESVSLIQDGYTCIYSVVDPNGADKPTVGTELRLSYFTSDENLTNIKEQMKNENHQTKITDIQSGFYALTPVVLALDREGFAIDLYRATNSLTTFLSGTDLDYEVLADDPAKACSLDEMLAVSSFISGKQDVQPAPPPAAQTEKSLGENCCEIIVADIAGAVEYKDGTKVTDDMRLQVGDKLYTVDSLLVIGIVCDDDPDNVRMFVVEADEPTEISIENGPDGNPIVVTDPGTAKTSIKELPAFATDFQVSTPRLTCSVRG